MTDVMRSMVEAQAQATTVEDILDELARTFQQQIGYRLCTLSVYEGGADLTARRIWTSHPEQYPVNGTKSKPDPEWAAQVIERQKPFLCRDKADVQRVLFDYETIFQLGCGSVLNLPVRLFGSVIGTVNLLHEEHWFTPERVEKAEALVALVYAPMLLVRGAAGSIPMLATATP
jgi:transcriptional regulator with GAF, ATPase, and Fis domain